MYVVFQTVKKEAGCNAGENRKNVRRISPKRLTSLED